MIHNSKYRYLIPNVVTFTSLACGVVSMIAAGSGELMLAGILILASYVLDLLDGELARRLDAGTDFGLQLDSLTDLVSLGAAPAMLAYFHLSGEGNVALTVLGPAIVIYVLAGAYRLARFNLLPVKAGQTDSVGLTISTSGATLALAVLSDIANSSEVIHNGFFIPLLVILSLLMVSRISYPSIVWVFSRRWANFLYMVYFVTTLVLLQLSFFHVWFLFNSGYLSAALVRAGYHVIEE